MYGQDMVSMDYDILNVLKTGVITMVFQFVMIYWISWKPKMEEICGKNMVLVSLHRLIVHRVLDLCKYGKIITNNSPLVLN